MNPWQLTVVWRGSHNPVWFDWLGPGLLSRPRLHHTTGGWDIGGTACDCFPQNEGEAKIRMPARHKYWIATIIVLFIVGFLIAFAPIGSPQGGGFAVNSTFRYTFAEPLVSSAAERSAKAKQIQKLLEDAGVVTMSVTLLDNATLEVETAAVTDEEAQKDKQAVTQILQKNFKGVGQPQTSSTATGRQPLWQPFDKLAIYPPKLQIRLGLDLQGGAHVVLRCLPQATMTFASPEGKPLVRSKQQTATASESSNVPGYQPTETRDSLSEKVKAVLVRKGVPADEITVEVPTPNLLIVKTRANDESTVKKHQQIVAQFLRSNYPGVEIEEKKPETVFVGKQTADKVKNIVSRRLYAMSEIREPLIQQQGDDQIIVELPGVKDPQRVMSILKSTALLEFRLIPSRYSLPAGAAETGDYSQWMDTATNEVVPWQQVYHESEQAFTGADLKSNARPQPGQAMDFVVAFELKNDKQIAFGDFTRRNVGRIMAIVLDGQCQMAPVIQSAITGGSGVITGNFDAQEAGDIALLLNAGALPVPLEIAENRTVSATLGQDTINRSLIAGGIAFGFVILFMIGFYRLPGMVAGVALILYLLLMLAVLVFVKATLTLPGVAGLILSIGFAVDANVIIYERLKEELWSGRTMRSAIEAGFSRAWTAILDANVTTLIVAAVLYFLGTSLIKSFAVVLFLGICVSLFTAVTVTRWMLTIVGRSSLGQNLALYGVKPRAEQ